MHLKNKINLINDCFKFLTSKKIQKYKINLIIVFISNFIEFNSCFKKSKYSSDIGYFNFVSRCVYRDQFFLSKFSFKNSFLLYNNKFNIFDNLRTKKNNFKIFFKLTIDIFKLIFFNFVNNQNLLFYHPKKNNPENIKQILKNKKYNDFFFFKYSDYTFLPNYYSKQKKITNKETKNIIYLLKNIFAQYNMVNEYNLIQKVINDNLFYNLQFFKKLVNFFLGKKKIIIVDTSYSFLRNAFLNVINNSNSIGLIGYQHGGGYCELASHDKLSLEISSPIYNYGFINWGLFSKDYSAYVEKKINVIKFYKPNVIFYPTSGDLSSLEAFMHLSNTNYKKKLLNLIKSQNNPYFIKFHPTLNKKNITNLNQNDYDLGKHKPGICDKNIKYVILDSPGSTIFFECLKKKIPYIFCMPLGLFDLTTDAKKMYKKLYLEEKLINLDNSNNLNKLHKLLEN